MIACMTQRATRYPIECHVQFQPGGDAEWVAGKTVNISRTGVLLRSPCLLLPESPLAMELLIVMPELDSSTKILCMGKVVRSGEASGGNGEYLIAASIASFKFSRPQ